MSLIERIRYRLHCLWLGMTMKPIAGADGEGDPPGGEPSGEGKGAEPAKPAPPKEPEGEKKKPPWGSDEEFDPERAWKKIEAVEGDKTKLRERAEKAEQELKKHADAQKSDQEKLSERLSEAEGRASYADKLDVALDKAPDGMSAAQIRKLAKRLSGSTQEELEADAEELFADFASPEDDKGAKPRRPRERLRPGAAPSADAEKKGPAELAEQVPRGW